MRNKFKNSFYIFCFFWIGNVNAQSIDTLGLFLSKQEYKFSKSYKRGTPKYIRKYLKHVGDGFKIGKNPNVYGDNIKVFIKSQKRFRYLIFSALSEKAYVISYKKGGKTINYYIAIILIDNDLKKVQKLYYFIVDTELSWVQLINIFQKGNIIFRNSDEGI